MKLYGVYDPKGKLRGAVTTKGEAWMTARWLEHSFGVSSGHFDAKGWRVVEGKFVAKENEERNEMNLPSGTTQDDIDVAMGAAAHCYVCRLTYSTEHAECPRCAQRYIDADYLRDRERDDKLWRGE